MEDTTLTLSSTALVNTIVGLAEKVKDKDGEESAKACVSTCFRTYVDEGDAGLKEALGTYEKHLAEV